MRQKRGRRGEHDNRQQLMRNYDTTVCFILFRSDVNEIRSCAAIDASRHQDAILLALPLSPLNGRIYLTVSW